MIDHEREPDQSPLLRVRDLTVSFTTRTDQSSRAVDGVSLSVHPGQTLAVVGESGSGKSVTALAIMGLLPGAAKRERGSIVFDGRELTQLEPRELRRTRGGDIAMIFQEPMTALNPVLTVGEQVIEAVQLHQRVSRRQAKRIAIDALREVGITDAATRHRAYPHEFSGGMRQRVMIAMAMVGRPRLLLADEPTTALDVTIQAQILDLLDDLQVRHGLAMMLITHDLGIVAQRADVACVMHGGRVMEYAAVNDLLRSPRHPYTRGLLAAVPVIGQDRERLRTIADVMCEERSPDPKSTSSPRCWWTTDDPTQYVLAEVQPLHWVAMARSVGDEVVPEDPPCVDARRRRAGVRRSA